jgi:Oxoglutarate and iron-dependent oxygenase degradation C-term/2OG-Fe(II) oxygenase superfamily
MLGEIRRDTLGEPDQVKLRIEPGHNSLLLFETTPASFYALSEVLGDRPVPSIVGWFRGPVSHRLALRDFRPYPSRSLSKDDDEPDLSTLINPAYLDEEMIGEIKKLFCDNSSVTLFKFFLPEVYTDILRERKETEWSSDPVGPASVRRYHFPSCSSQPTLRRLFRSFAFRDMLAKWTTLEPARSVRLNPRFFSTGCYTMLHDQAQDPSGLDVILGLNDDSSEWGEEWGGDMIWTAVNAGEDGEAERHDGAGNATADVPSPQNPADESTQGVTQLQTSTEAVKNIKMEEKITNYDPEGGSGESEQDDDDRDEALLALAPTPNALTIVLRDHHTLKHVRYVNAGAKQGPDQGRIDVEAVYLGDWFKDEESR